MFLRSLTLSNIRCYPDLTVDFAGDDGGARRWTVLLGENGTGKSTLLRALALILAGSEALIVLLEDPQTWVRNGEEVAYIRAEIENAEGERRHLELELRRDDKRSDVLRRCESTLEELDRALAHTSRSYFVVGYGSARRLGEPGMSSGGTDKRSGVVRARSVATLFNPYEQLLPLETWAMSLDYRDEKEGLATVADTLSDFLPEVTFDHIDRQREELIFETPDGPTPLRQMSDGYQCVAAWVGDLLYQIGNAFDDYRDPLSARGLLILDEIDLHLHPKWQRRLLRFLEEKLPNFQIVATTHSAVTAQQAEEGALFYLKRDDRTVRLHAFETDPGSLLVNQLLTTEAFGLSSDESLDVELEKERYRELSRKDERSPDEEDELTSIRERHAKRPLAEGEAPYLTEKQRELLERMRSTFDPQ